MTINNKKVIELYFYVMNFFVVECYIVKNETQMIQFTEADLGGGCRVCSPPSPGMTCGFQTSPVN